MADAATATTGSSGDDAAAGTKKKRQTKRDCAEVVEDHTRDDSGVSAQTRKLRKYSPTKNNEEEDTNGNTTNSVPATSTSTNTGKTEDDTGNDKASKKKTEKVEDVVDKNQASPFESSPTDAPETPTMDNNDNNNNNHQSMGKRVLDLESAIHYAASIGEGEKEPLSHGYNLSFRVGHAGDAATLANWYRQKSSENPSDEENPKTSSSSSSSSLIDKNAAETLDPSINLSTVTTTPATQSTEESNSSAPASSSASPAPLGSDQGAASSLELWLEDGLGDEEFPPSVFALIADVTPDSVVVDDTSEEASNNNNNNNNNKSQMAAVALLTSSWEDSSRVLRLEWFRVDDDIPCKRLVEKRMWLRLSLLSLATASELRVMDPFALAPATKNRQQPV